MEKIITGIGRVPRMRTTLYRDVAPERKQRAFQAAQLLDVENARAGKQQSSKRLSRLVQVSQ